MQQQVILETNPLFMPYILYMHCRIYLLVMVNALLTGGACTKSSEVTPEPFREDSLQHAAVVHGTGTAFLALGDSYTIGASVAAEERFPAQIKDILHELGKDIPSPQYIAVSGWTTASLQNAITQQNPADTFGIVTLLIGVNDQYQGFDVTGYKQRFKTLLQKSIQLAGNRKERVFVLSIPDYGVTPFGKGSDPVRIGTEIDAFNTANEEITSSLNVSYTDITPISREALNDLTLVAPDGLHPSGKMYNRWAELVAPKIEAVLD